MNKPLPKTSACGLLINGRFLTRTPTGVDRVAFELMQNLIEASREEEGVSISVATPNSDINQNYDLGDTSPLGRFLKGHIWEQCVLPFVKRKEWLLSFCNIGPIFRKRHVVFIHDAQVYTNPKSYSWAFRAYYRLMLPLVSRTASIVVTVSEFAKSELERCGAIPRGKAITIHNGCDHMDRITANKDALTKFDLERGQFFLAIGSVAPHKNISRLVEAMSARPNTATPLVIVGNKNSQIFKDVDIQQTPNVRFVGHVSDQDLKGLYQEAKALVFPSITEGFGLPPLEAMRCGCPVIATTGGAVPEICSDAVLYADPFQPNEWIDAMDAMCRNAELRQKLVALGLQQASKFTWARAANQLLSEISASQNNTAKR